jgi:hypothetical protein
MEVFKKEILSIHNKLFWLVKKTVLMVKTKDHSQICRQIRIDNSLFFK